MRSQTLTNFSFFFSVGAENLLMLNTTTRAGVLQYRPNEKETMSFTCTFVST